MNQTEIIETLGVGKTFDAETEARRRIDFLKDYLTRSSMETYVLGISGGIDSTTAATLAQRAVSELRQEGKTARFVAVRLPYGKQADEADAQAAIASIGPDAVHTIDIKPAADAMWEQVKASGFVPSGQAQADFLLGNVKARQRMIAQYALAGGMRGLVIGTDHAAEALMGFFTKFGDGAADVLPLSGLNKRRVRAVGAFLGVPQALVQKVPTADLEDGAPLRPDEEAFGVTYEEIDDFLEGKQISPASEAIIMRFYRNSMHKRALPVGPV
jgi:NAD+ synthase